MTKKELLEFLEYAEGLCAYEEADDIVVLSFRRAATDVRLRIQQEGVTDQEGQ